MSTHRTSLAFTPYIRELFQPPWTDNLVTTIALSVP
jgi:hypothetical protein